MRLDEACRDGRFRSGKPHGMEWCHSVQMCSAEMTNLRVSVVNILVVASRSLVSVKTKINYT